MSQFVPADVFVDAEMRFGGAFSPTRAVRKGGAQEGRGGATLFIQFQQGEDNDGVLAGDGAEGGRIRIWGHQIKSEVGGGGQQDGSDNADAVIAAGEEDEAVGAEIGRAHV